MGAFGFCFRMAVVVGWLLITLLAVKVGLILMERPVLAPGLTSEPFVMPPGRFVRREASGGVHLNVFECGPEDGELLVMLHGFPETALMSWHRQLRALCTGGWRIIAPDQRGYNTSDKPSGRYSYLMPALTADVAALIRGAGRASATVIAHDWGAAVAWAFANEHPEMVQRLAILNVPHPAVFGPYLVRSLKQFLKSWYIFFFQLPYFPEIRLTKEDFLYLRSIFRRPAGVYSQDEEQIRIQGWSEPGAITAMVNWYRALPLSLSSADPNPPPIQPETLIIWGKQDIALEAEMAELSAKRCRSARLVFLEDASHFVQADAADEVNRMLLEFIAQPQEPENKTPPTNAQ